ncbi:hypothetical protein Gogos_002441, partial [Gossypium gossypioides]|nr:hypothetical protein [Gossypium gossypioides]
MSVEFPYLYSSTALMCLMGSIQGTLYAVCTGIMGSTLFVFLVSWVVRLKGPLYAIIFNPLGLVLVAVVGSLLLDEKLHLGRAKEMKQQTQVDEESNEIVEDEQENEGTETPP